MTYTVEVGRQQGVRPNKMEEWTYISLDSPPWAAHGVGASAEAVCGDLSGESSW